MTRFLVAFSLVLLVLISFASHGVAQMLDTGLPPFSSHQQAGPDLINLNSLNVHYSIPIFRRPGRGLPFSYNISIDSQGWRNLRVFSLGGGLLTGGVSSFVGVAQYDLQTNACMSGQTQYTYNTYSLQNYTDPVGTSHPFNLTVNIGPNTCTPAPRNTSVTGVATDGSGLTMTFGQGFATVTLTTGEVINTFLSGPNTSP